MMDLRQRHQESYATRGFRRWLCATRPASLFGASIRNLTLHRRFNHSPRFAFLFAFGLNETTKGSAWDGSVLVNEDMILSFSDTFQQYRCHSGNHRMDAFDALDRSPRRAIRAKPTDMPNSGRGNWARGGIAGPYLHGADGAATPCCPQIRCRISRQVLAEQQEGSSSLDFHA